MMRWTRLLPMVAMAAVIAACAGGGGATASPSAVVATPPQTSVPATGSGVITFGHDYDPASLSIIKRSSKFRTNEPEIAWRAEFSEAARAPSVQFVLAGVGAGGVETPIERLDVAIDSPDFKLLANKADLTSLVKHRAGTYVMRYVRGDTVLAEGTFKLVK